MTQIAIDTNKNSKIKPNVRYMRDKDREMVKGIFRDYEVPGGNTSFCFRAYKEDPVERYDFVDGQVYTIPLGVAKHLNKNCWYPEYEYAKTDNKVIETGFGPNTAMRIGKKVRRFGFQSLDFIDSEDLLELGAPSKILTVESV